MIETKHEKFKRVAEKRVLDILHKLDTLSNLSNKSNYAYEEEDIKKIFSAIENKVKEIKVNFKIDKNIEFKL